MQDIKSGYVAIIGRPNTGKSTFLNNILEQHIAAVCHRPETTRNRILGIYNDRGCQIIFMDTPGIHKPQHELGRKMVRAAWDAGGEADIVLLFIDARGVTSDDINLFKKIKDWKQNKLLAINKIDLIQKSKILKIIEECKKICEFDEHLPLSALNREDVSFVTGVIKKYLPPGPRYFPIDQITDKDDRFIASEIIREEALWQLQEEVPHAVAVVVEEFKRREAKDLLYIRATIYVERSSQKAIVIGQRGMRLKSIGEKSRIKLEGYFGQKVYLDLWVKVEKNWRKNRVFLKRIGI
ncbi:MAG: GTPase Era [Candidatus Omnitrophota bacterium]